MSGMHFLIGCRTDNFVILASDKAAFAHGAITVSKEDNKNVKLGDKLYMCCIGKEGDIANFKDTSQAGLRLYKMRNGYELTPSATHFWLRKSIADEYHFIYICLSSLFKYNTVDRSMFVKNAYMHVISDRGAYIPALMLLLNIPQLLAKTFPQH